MLERLNKKIKKDSVLTVLKKGLDIDDTHFDLLYRLPYNDLNPEVAANFEANRFSVTRQVHYSQTACSTPPQRLHNAIGVTASDIIGRPLSRQPH